MTENFGSSPEEFDLDAWIDQATRPRREVTIYRDWGLLEEYQRLVEQMDASGADDEAMGEVSAQEQIDDVIARMEASQLTFTLEAVSTEEWEALRKAAPKEKVDLGNGKTREVPEQVAFSDLVLSASIVEPEVTTEQLARLRGKLGDGPMAPLYLAADELRKVGKALPAVPTSRES